MGRDIQTDQGLENVLTEIAQKYEAALESIVGKRVIKRIKPAKEVGITDCFLFENGVVLEIGVPFTPSRGSFRDRERKYDDTIGTFNIYTVDDIDQEYLPGEENPAVIAYYRRILQEYGRKVDM